MEKVIKSAKAFSHQENPDGSTNKVIRSEELFDDEGRKLKEVVYSPTGDVESGTNWELNGKGKVIKATSLLHGEVTEDKVLKYDNEDRIIGKEVSYAGGGKTVTEVIYEDDKVTEVSSDEDGELEERKITLLNDKEFVAREEIYDHDDVLMKWTKNDFNGDDKVATRVEFDVQDGFEITRDYTYNENGYLESVLIKRRDKKIGFVKFEYDQKGNRISENHNGQLGITTTYDEKDRVIRTEYKNLDHNMVERYSEFRFEGDLLMEEEHFSVSHPLEVISYTYEFH